jgi:hypothetical protein
MIDLMSDSEKQEMIDSGDHVAFVMNIEELLEVDSLPLSEEHILRKATGDEVMLIKEQLSWYFGSPFSPHHYFWEHSWPQVPGDVVRLPPERWRYFVVAFRGSNQILHRLQSAFDLACVELEVGIEILRLPGGATATTGLGPRFFHVFQAATENPFNKDFFLRIGIEDVRPIATLAEKLKNHDHNLLDLRGPLRQLGDLKSLHHASPLRFLGYFAILESLLTHQPKQTDPYESITRQVKSKLALLNNRWGTPLDYTAFNAKSHEKVWGNMYACRSKIAHAVATPADLVAYMAELVKDSSDAGIPLSLLKETVKAVLRHSLDDPQLIVDLKNC